MTWRFRVSSLSSRRGRRPADKPAIALAIRAAPTKQRAQDRAEPGAARKHLPKRRQRALKKPSPCLEPPVQIIIYLGCSE